jgi:hypothetical protein
MIKGCSHKNLEIDSKNPIKRTCMNCGRIFQYPEEWNMKREDL